MVGCDVLDVDGDGAVVKGAEGYGRRHADEGRFVSRHVGHAEEKESGATERYGLRRRNDTSTIIIIIISANSFLLLLLPVLLLLFLLSLLLLL